MIVDVSRPFDERVEQALGDEGLHTALDRATTRLAGRRAAAMAEAERAGLRVRARAARESAIAHLPDLLEELERNLRSNGCQVHWARDAEEARSLTLEIAVDHRVGRVVKSKSMVSEEIGLNDALEAEGIDVVETDLGEFIIQLAGEPPSHIIAPVIHKRAEEISELFQRKLGMAPADDPATLCATARRYLRRRFLDADMGVSGCNFAVAETGTICLVTNEGNGRMVTSLPRVYVAIAGIEKVVSTIDDAVMLWQAASRSATGQDASVYFSLSSGPRRPGHPDGPDAMHVVLLDNGRSRILERGYAEALLCIRCGACLNACPVYREIGGHAYGPTPYSGPIGAVITPLLSDGQQGVELPFASSLCGACRDACPVKIDIPRMLLELRSDIVSGGAASRAERAGIAAFAGVLGRPRLFRLVRALARWATRILALRGRRVRRSPPPLNRWTRSRDFPTLPKESFRAIWARSRQRGRGRS